MSDNEADQYESDGDDFNPSAHKKLLTGVSGLQKSQFIKKATRDEPALKRGEFNLVKLSTVGNDAKSKKSKVDVGDLVNMLDRTNKQLQLGKVLKKTAEKKKVLPVPLKKPAAEKLQRAINYEKAKEKLERWDAVVAKNRSTDHLAFPLDQDPSDLKVKDNLQLPSKLRIKSEMMLEMEKIEPQIFHMENPTDTEKDEDEPKLTSEELIQRSRELRQLRIKESQRSAKAHHQNKIKSKKCHRILKKEKMKQQIKEFELLQKTDPEAALRKIEQLDKSRIEERANLGHRNTGTWAKNLQVRAKYGKDARKDLAEQIAISRELTAKKKVEDSDDDDDDEITGLDGDEESVPFNPFIKVGQTMNGSKKENDVGEFLSGYRKYWQERNEKTKELAEYKAEDSVKNDETVRSDEDEQIGELASNERPVKSKKSKKLATKSKLIKKKSKVSNGWLEEDMSDVQSTNSKKKKKKVEKSNREEKLGKKLKKEKKKASIVENIDDLFDDSEDTMRVKYKKKLEKLQSELVSNRNSKRSKNEDSDGDEVVEDSQVMDLRFKKQNKRTLLDEALNADDINDDNPLTKQIAKTLNAITSNGQQGSQPSTETSTKYESENINQMILLR